MDTGQLFAVNQKRIDEEIQRHEEAILRINEELHRHKDAIVSLKHQRNMHSSISTLPPEMLCRIFSFATLLGRSYAGHTHLDRYGVPTWITQIIHVCRRWRSVALNAPELWTEIPLSHKRWTKVMLQRSKMANITLDSPSYRTITVPAFKLAMAHQKRISRLCLELKPGTYSSLQKHWPTSIPNLQSITINVIRTYVDERFEGLPSKSFMDGVRLRSVHFAGIAIDWEKFIFSNLTQVKVCGPLGVANPCGTMDDLRGAIENMPHLVALILDGILPRLGDGHGGDPSAFTSIPLVELRKLTVRGHWESVAAILQMLTYPPLDHLNLYFLDYHDDIVLDMLKHVDWQPSLDPSHSPNHITSLYLSSDEFDGRIYLFIKGFAEPSGPNWNISTVAMYFSPDEQPRYPSLEDMLSPLPVHQVTSVTLNLRTMVFCDWQEIIGCLPQLNHMDIFDSHSEYCSSFVSSLSLRHIHNSVGSDVFANLRAITLRSNDFLRTGHSYLDIDKLVNTLVDRREIELEIRRLKLIKCRHVYDAGIGRLKEIVADVEWDGYEGSTESEGGDLEELSEAEGLLLMFSE